MEYYKQRNNPERSALVTRYYLIYVISYLGCDKQINNINYHELQNYLKCIKNKRGESSAHWNYILFSKLFSYAFRHGYIKSNPFAYIKAYKIPYTSKRIHDMNKIKNAIKIIAKSKNSGLRNKIIIGLSILCGMRANEIIALNSQDVDIANKAIYIKNTKNLISRCIPIDNPLLRWINIYMSEREGGHNAEPLLLLAGSKCCRITRPVLASISYAIKQCQNIEINPNILRHHFSSYLFDGGVGISKLKYLLGHNDEERTSNYVSINPAKIKISLLKNPLLSVFK